MLIVIKRQFGSKMFAQASNEAPEQPDPQNQPPNDRRSRLQPTKKPKETFAIRPDHFQGKKGLRALYEKTKDLKLDQHSEVNVENTMKRLVMVLKSWHFEAAPKYTFDYFLQRCQALGTHKQVIAYMSKVRKIHKGLDSWEQTANPEGQGEIGVQEGVQPSRMEEEGKEAMVMMSSFGKADQRLEMDEQDRQWLQLMQQVEKKEKEKNLKDERQDEPNQPYVPEGFQFDFSEEEN